MAARGTIKIKRSIRRWQPEVSKTSSGNYRVALTHPKNAKARGISTHQYVDVAIHAAQKQAIEVFEARKATEGSLKNATSIITGEDS